MPQDKSPGPDGMTAAFYKAAWPIIKPDVLRAVNAFFAADCRGFACINNALLTLIPKKPGARSSKDYRPISLIHSFPKLMSKLLANRLSTCIGEMVLCNQSAFISGRSILDNFKYVQRSARCLNYCLRWTFLRPSTRCLGSSCWRCCKPGVLAADGGIGYLCSSPQRPPVFC